MTYRINLLLPPDTGLTVNRIDLQEQAPPRVGDHVALEVIDRSLEAVARVVVFEVAEVTHVFRHYEATEADARSLTWWASVTVRLVRCTKEPSVIRS